MGRDGILRIGKHTLERSGQVGGLRCEQIGVEEFLMAWVLVL